MAVPQDICMSGSFRIRADGTWLHDGRPIARPALVRLFAGVLRREADGRFFLVTPAEKVPVLVDDAPYVAVEMEATGTGPGGEIRLRTNADAWVRLDFGHPLVVRAAATGPRPYAVLGDGLEALIARSVFYDIARLAVPGPDGTIGVWSAGAFFSLAPPEGER